MRIELFTELVIKRSAFALDGTEPASQLHVPWYTRYGFFVQLGFTMTECYYPDTSRLAATALVESITLHNGHPFS